MGVFKFNQNECISDDGHYLIDSDTRLPIKRFIPNRAYIPTDDLSIYVVGDMEHYALDVDNIEDREKFEELAVTINLKKAMLAEGLDMNNEEDCKIFEKIMSGDFSDDCENEHSDLMLQYLKNKELIDVEVASQLEFQNSLKAASSNTSVSSVTNPTSTNASAASSGSHASTNASAASSGSHASTNASSASSGSHASTATGTIAPDSVSRQTGSLVAGDEQVSIGFEKSCKILITDTDDDENDMDIHNEKDTLDIDNEIDTVVTDEEILKNFVIGRSMGRGQTDNMQDLFYTPAWTVRTLVPIITQVLDEGSHTLYDPCCGNHVFKNVLEYVFNHDVIEDDLYTMPDKVDFLACNSLPSGVEMIVTNPPYSGNNQLKFLKKCFSFNIPFALLLPMSAFITSKRMSVIKEYGIDIHIIYPSPRFIDKKGKSVNVREPAWFVWNGKKTPNTFNLYYALKHDIVIPPHMEYDAHSEDLSEISNVSGDAIEKENA